MFPSFRSFLPGCSYYWQGNCNAYAYVGPQPRRYSFQQPVHISQSSHYWNIFVPKKQYFLFKHPLPATCTSYCWTGAKSLKIWIYDAQVWHNHLQRLTAVEILAVKNYKFGDKKVFKAQFNKLWVNFWLYLYQCVVLRIELWFK